MTGHITECPCGPAWALVDLPGPSWAPWALIGNALMGPPGRPPSHLTPHGDHSIPPVLT